MPGWEPTVSGNTKSQQRQIDKLGTARMGPVSVGPGDGYTRYFDADGRTTFRTDGDGASVFAHDALRPLGGVIESKASQTYVDGNIATLVTRDGELQADINTRATRTYVDGNIATVVGRLNGHDSTLSSHDTRISNAQSRADDAHGDAATAQARADNAHSDAASAQSRADAAYSLASGASGDASSLAGRVAYLEGRDQSTRDILVNLIDRVVALEDAIQP